MRVRANAYYYFKPVPIDLYDSRSDLKKGERVQVVNLPGCPPANTMGMCHVNHADTGKFAGLVCTSSLQKEPVQ